MIESKEKEIDEMKITVSQFPARAGFKMQARLVKLFAPFVGEIIGGIKTKKEQKLMESDVDLSKIPNAVKELFEHLDEDSAMQLVFDLLQLTKVNGQDVNEETFDLMFPGKYLTLYKIIGFVLEVNYGSFFGKSGIGQVFKKMTTASHPMPQAS
jgi:hypothetical protein